MLLLRRDSLLDSESICLLSPGKRRTYRTSALSEDRARYYLWYLPSEHCYGREGVKLNKQNEEDSPNDFSNGLSPSWNCLKGRTSDPTQAR